MGPRDHEFVRSTNPNFGSAFGGGCDHQQDGVFCGWPESAHLRDGLDDPRHIYNVRARRAADQAEKDLFRELQHEIDGPQQTVIGMLKRAFEQTANEENR